MTENTEITIDRIDLAEGWVCFQGGEKPPAADQLPQYLNHAMTTWLQRNSEFQVRAALPVEVDGNTIAIHVWFS